MYLNLDKGKQRKEESSILENSGAAGRPVSRERDRRPPPAESSKPRPWPITRLWGGTGPEIIPYGLNEYGEMVEIFYDYIPNRFSSGFVRGLGIGTPLYLSPEMDLFMDYGGTMFWAVLYSGGWSHCAVLIGDFGF